MLQATSLQLHRGGAADDLDDLFRDLRLAGAVHDERQGIDHVSRIVGGRIHGGHAGRMLGGHRLQQRAENLDTYVLRQQWR